MITDAVLDIMYAIAHETAISKELAGRLSLADWLELDELQRDYVASNSRVNYFVDEEVALRIVDRRLVTSDAHRKFMSVE